MAGYTRIINCRPCCNLYWLPLPCQLMLAQLWKTVPILTTAVLHERFLLNFWKFGLWRLQTLQKQKSAYFNYRIFLCDNLQLFSTRCLILICEIFVAQLQLNFAIMLCYISPFVCHCCCIYNQSNVCITYILWFVYNTMCFITVSEINSNAIYMLTLVCGCERRNNYRVLTGLKKSWNWLVRALKSPKVALCASPKKVWKLSYKVQTKLMTEVMFFQIQFCIDSDNLWEIICYLQMAVSTEI